MWPSAANIFLTWWFLPSVIVNSTYETVKTLNSISWNSSNVYREFEIIKDSKKFIVEAGESKDYRFKLKKGENNITLRGNGTIEFRFRKEVL